jgi:K+-sensing histidine kinase KdpD
MARCRAGGTFYARILASSLRRLRSFSGMSNRPKAKTRFAFDGSPVATGRVANPRRAVQQIVLNAFLFPLMLVGATTLVLMLALRHSLLEFNLILYLLPVMISAVRWGVVPAMVAALASVAASDFFFLPPLYSFVLSNPSDAVDLALFLFVAVVTGNLAAKLQREVDSSHRREHEIHHLYLLSRRLALCSTASDLVAAIQEYLTSHLGCEAFLIRPPHESSESDVPIDSPSMSTRLRVEAAEMIAAADPRSRLVFDPHLRNLWALKSISTQATDHGVLAVNLGRHSPRETSRLTDRIEAVLSEAAATLMRIDAVTAVANADLRLQSDFLKTALIGSVSHELRSPIASILGAASVLDGIPALRNNRRVRSLVDGMHREAKRLDSDIQNLLDSMRITDTGVKPVMEWTDPGDVITAAIRQRSHRLAAHRLDVDIADGLPLLKLDSGLIEQAVGQVIENAGKYSPVASTISIMVRADSGELIIAVTDQGMGLMPDEAAEMFKRAFRGRRQLGTIPGLGLGLWIAKIFVAANRGSIAARSSGPGRGTTVTIHVPVNADAAISHHAHIS